MGGHVPIEIHLNKRSSKTTKVQKGETEQDLIARLKVEYLKYYSQLPVQRAAADSIGRDEDTIIKWRNADPDFAEACQRAKSDYAMKHGKKRHDRILSHLYDEFRDSPVEIAGGLDLNLNHDVKDQSALSELIAQSGFVPASAGDHPEKG